MTQPQVPPGGIVEIEAPDGTIIEFPSSMKEDEINSAMAKMYGGPTSDPAPAPFTGAQSPEKAPVVGAEAGPTPSASVFDSSSKPLENQFAPSDAAGDELATGSAIQSQSSTAPDAISPKESALHETIKRGLEDNLKRAATIAKRDFVPEDQSQYVYLNTDPNQIQGFDPRSAKAEKDFLHYGQVAGDRKTQFSSQNRQQQISDRAWTAKDEINYQADILVHESDVLLGRKLKMDEAIASGVDPAVFANEAKDIEAGRVFLASKFNEIGQRDPRSLLDKYNERVQAQTDAEGRSWYGDTYRRFMQDGRELVGGWAVAGLSVLDPSGNYTMADMLRDKIDETESMMSTDIASAHKGGVYSKAEGWRGKAAVPMLGSGLAQLLGFVGSSTVGGAAARGLVRGRELLSAGRALSSSSAQLAAAQATGGSAGLVGSAFLAGYDQYVDEGIANGEKKEDLDAPAKVFGGLNAVAERFINPQLWLTRGPSAKNAFIETIRAGGTVGEAAKSFAIGAGQETLEELTVNYGKAAVNAVSNELAGTNLETNVSAEDNINSTFAAVFLGGLGEIGGGQNFGSKKLKQQAVVWAMNNPNEATKLIERFVPKDEQKPFIEKLDGLTKTYVGNMLGGLSTEKAAKVADLVEKKRKVEKNLKDAPMDEALAGVMQDPREEERETLAREILTNMGVEGQKQEDALIAAGIIEAPLDAEGKPIKVKPTKKVAPPTQADEEVVQEVDPDEEVEIDRNDDEDLDLDGALASVTPGMNKALDKEVEMAAKSLSGIGVKIVVHDELDTFGSAYSEAGGQAGVNHSQHEGFYDQKGRTIHINRTLNRSGLAAHEGVHALFMSAIGATENGRVIITEAAKQVLNESPETRVSIAWFLESYGGAVRKADGSIDVYATAANPKLAHEVFAEFVSSVANGATKLNAGVRTFLKDMYNKVMATLGVSMKFDPKSDDDFIKLAADLASAMKTGRVIRSAAVDAEISASPASSVRRASDLAQQLEVEATQAEKVFFGDIWPNLLKKVGNVFKPTKAGFQQAADLAVSDVNEFIKENPKYQNYYHKDWELVAEMVSNAFPIVKEKPELMGVFRVIAGLMSPQTPLKQNMKEAVSAFDHWLNKGSFDAVKIVPSGNLYKMGKTPFVISANTAVNKARSIKAFDQLLKKHGPKKAVEMLMEPVSVEELKKVNSSLGYVAVGDIGRIKNAVRAATGQDEKIPRVFVFGPKLGAYTMNSLGDGRYTTVDIWESRFIRSYFPKMFATAGGVIANKVDDAEVLTEFSNQFAKAFKERNGFDLEPSAYQAMRWYTMIDAARKANYKYALTDGTISEYTAEALRDIKGHIVSGYTGRSGYQSTKQDDPNYVPFSIKRGSPGRNLRGRPEREPDGSLKGLPRTVKVGDTQINASHWQPAEDVAAGYMKSAGLPYTPPNTYAKVDPARASKIAQAYDEMKHAPNDPEVAKAYAALASETAAQYEAVMKSGLKVEFIPPGSPDPYAASPRLATEDIRNNNHMWVFGTRDGFGSGDFDPKQSPMLKPTSFEISGQPALVNDLFRVVHDYFGHVKEGLGFRADGEENAWRAHSSMFTPEAQRALTTETRGQNSWVNFGPHGEKNRKASGSETVYADQKVGLMPMWVSEEGRYDNDVDMQAIAAESDQRAPVSQGPMLSIKRATPGENIVPKDVQKNLTKDGDGNYLFYHYGHDLKGGRINPKYAGTGVDRTSRNTSRNNDISMYYTKPDEQESMVTGDVHVVKVPDFKVYPFNKDPLNLIDKAEELFRKDYGDYVAFDAVKQADYMGPLAAKAGFDIMVTKWSAFPLRGETTKALRWDREATDKARLEPASSAGSQKFNEIARALIAAGHNTKAKAKAYLKGRGHEGISDAVIEEMGRILKAQREIKNRKDETPATPEQAVAVDAAISSIVSDEERAELKAKIEADAKIAQAATKAAAIGFQKGASAGYNQGVASGTLAGQMSGKAAGRKEGAQEAAAEAARQRNIFVKQLRLHLESIGGRLSQARVNAILTRAVSVNPGNKEQVERFLYYLYAKIDEANDASTEKKRETILELTDPARYRKTDNGIVKGKIDDRVRKLLATIHSAVKGMTLEQVSDAIDAIDAALSAPDANVGLLEDQLEAYRIAHGALSMNPEGVAAAEEAIKQIIEEGRSSFRETLAAKHARYVAMRQEALAAITGGKGVKTGFEEVAHDEKQRGVASRILDSIGSYLDQNEGFRTLLDKIDRSARNGNPWSGMLDQFYRKVAAGRNTMDSRSESTAKEIQNKLEEIYGGKKPLQRAVNANSKVSSLGNFTDLNGKNVEILLSQNRAYYLYNLMKSPDNEATFVEMGFTEEMKNAVVDFMTPEVKEWADWQTDVFYPKMYQDVNRVYRGLNYIDLPQSKNYTPIRRKGVDDSAPIEAGKFQRSAAGVVSGSLKERTGSKKPFDLTIDGGSLLHQYVGQMNHYIAFAEVVRDLNATFGSSEVKTAIKQNANSKDNEIIAGFIDAIANDGRNRSLAISLFDKLRGLHATAKLSLNAVVALKQLSAQPAYLTDLSPKDFAIGLLDFMRHPIEASNILMESAYLKARYKNGFDRDMAIAMARNYQQSFTGKSTLMDKIMINVRWGDQAAVFSGGWAVYRYHHNKATKAGKSEAEAKRIGLSEMDEATKMSQQSTNTEDMSHFQRGGTFGKLFTMYKTSPLSYFRQERKGIRDMVRGLKTGDKVLAGDGLRRFIVYHFVLPAVFQFVANALPGLLTEPDDDDEKDMYRALALGSINGVFIFGDALEFIGERIVGKPWAISKGAQGIEVPIFKSMLDLLRSAADIGIHWANDDDKLTEDIMETLREGADLGGIPAKKLDKMVENAEFTADNWGELTPGERAALITGYDPREIGDGYGGHLQAPDNQ